MLPRIQPGSDRRIGSSDGERSYRVIADLITHELDPDEAPHEVPADSLTLELCLAQQPTKAGIEQFLRALGYDVHDQRGQWCLISWQTCELDGVEEEIF